MRRQGQAGHFSTYSPECMRQISPGPVIVCPLCVQPHISRRSFGHDKCTFQFAVKPPCRYPAHTSVHSCSVYTGCCSPSPVPANGRGVVWGLSSVALVPKLQLLSATYMAKNNVSIYFRDTVVSCMATLNAGSYKQHSIKGDLYRNTFNM